MDSELIMVSIHSSVLIYDLQILIFSSPRSSIYYYFITIIMTTFTIIITIRMDLEEMGINAGNWIDSAQDRNYWKALVNAAMNLRVP